MGIKERKVRAYEERKELILFTAKEMFSQKGFKNVTIDEIAEKVEFSKGTIYTHFHSKEEIYAEIVLDGLTILQDYLQQAIESSKNSIQAIQKCLEIYIKFYNEHKEYSRILFFLDVLSDHYKIPNEILKELHVKKTACLNKFQQVISQGINSGEIKTKFSHSQVAHILWGMINGVIHLVESNQIKNSELDLLCNLGYEIVINGLKNADHE